MQWLSRGLCTNLDKDYAIVYHVTMKRTTISLNDNEIEQLSKLARDLGSLDRKRPGGAKGLLPIKALLRDMAAITELVLEEQPGTVRRALNGGASDG